MSTWPAVTADHDLGDMPALTASIRPFSEVFPPQRDPALAPEPTTEQILAEVRAIRPDMAKLADLVEDNPRLSAQTAGVLADLEQARTRLREVA